MTYCSYDVRDDPVDVTVIRVKGLQPVKHDNLIKKLPCHVMTLKSHPSGWFCLHCSIPQFLL